MALEKRTKLLPETDHNWSSDPWLTLDAIGIGNPNRLEIALSGVKLDKAPRKQQCTSYLHNK